MMKANDANSINCLKMLGIDMIDKAKSGHPGIVLGAANVLYTLYAKVLKINPHDPNWFNRDRFVMSAGHGSALLYAMLYMSGYDLTMSDLKNFRRINSLTPGHPEYGVTPGVDATTGPLGQGIANAVGIALAERYYNNLSLKYYSDNALIDYYTYVFCGDGDLMEGISYEALSFAGTQNLNKLIVIYDANHISLDGPTSISFDESVIDRMKALGFNTQAIESDSNLIEKAIKKAKKSDRPSFIYVESVIGEGSKLENTNTVHGKPLDEEDILSLRSRLKVSPEPFTVPAEILEYIHTNIKNRCLKEYEEWQNEKTIICNSNKMIKQIFNNIEKDTLSIDFDLSNFEISDDYEEDLRETNQKIMNIVARKTPFFVGGSADLSSSTKTFIFNEGFMSFNEPLNRNIPFGVREHAMGGILNGMALTKLNVFGSTFLTFSDYLKPAIRLSAMQNLNVTYIFTHDSILIGQDGPTHQPIEQLVSLRSIPNVVLYRPCDINELIGVWNQIVKTKGTNILSIARKDLSKLPGTSSELVKNGAYMVKKETKQLDAVIIASGSEVNMAIDVSDELDTIGIHTRVVSMVSQELFDKQSRDYKEELLPKKTIKIALELSTTNNYYKYTQKDFVIGVDDFGYSGSKSDVSEKMLVNYSSVKSRIEKIIRNN